MAAVSRRVHLHCEHLQRTARTDVGFSQSTWKLGRYLGEEGARLKTFGPFEIVRELGYGSAARVYEARWGNRPVALKVFDSGIHHHDRSAVLTRFQNEADAILHLDHPNIVKVVDAGIVDDCPYIAMELLSAESLDTRLRRANSLPVSEVTKILGPVADALDYAHSRWILHRDVKPSNILFGDGGRPVLSDFGVAKFMPSREQTTQGGHSDPPGTSDFLAPEVLEEAPHSVASDLYALGMTVYLALAGRLPTDGRTLFTRSRDRVAGDVIDLAKRNPNVPAAVAKQVMCALSADPRVRFSSAADFAATFRAAAAGAVNIPVSREPNVAPVDPDVKRTRRLDYWRYVVVPVIVAIIGGLAAWCQSK